MRWEEERWLVIHVADTQNTDTAWNKAECILCSKRLTRVGAVMGALVQLKCSVFVSLLSCSRFFTDHLFFRGPETEESRKQHEQGDNEYDD